MVNKITALLIICMLIVANASAEVGINPEYEGDYLYRVTTLRIEPGKLKDFLEWKERVDAAGFFKDAGDVEPFLMRHSQGDQWDLLVITPMQTRSEFHKVSREKKRARAAANHKILLTEGKKMIAFAEDSFAFGPALDTVKKAYGDNSFFHIEMFEAASGNAPALLEQRRMENVYLGATGQIQNMIFRRESGSDVDVFTIGFHESLEAFARPSGATAEEAEIAAKAAGFKDRADISFYLRSLISGHHDTLAVAVQ